VIRVEGSAPRSIRYVVRHDWRYTYRSARRDQWSRTAALRLFLREVRIGIRERRLP
jgi:hypothetical protein